jgi:nicotinamide phosphoribosyltransferase
VTRDTYGLAVKATYGEVNGEGRAIFKKPATDDGMKNSAKGLLSVWPAEAGGIYLQENCTWEEEAKGLLQDVFVDGKQHNITTLAEIRQRVDAQIAEELQ